ncbi:hypothetical protein NOCA2570032 [metagenome]|uniref:Uncharacterized protein n=1 Tax=metagenome TaxID=256318 RepID=A0A2P2CDR7_9ZZZZ
MSRFEYDEEASGRLHMDVVHEIDEGSGSSLSWVEAMRRLNAINDPLARKILALHRDCGSGTGECDSLDDEPGERQEWGCETTALVAAHFAIESH